MAEHITEADARLALRTIQDREHQVLAEVGLPRWYWWVLAVGWVALGAVSDLANAWAAAAATLVFGAAHAAIAQRVFSGQHRSSGISVRRDLAPRRLPLLLFGCLIILVVATVALAFAANADGARHASIVASVPIAVAILCGGPQVMVAVRRRQTRTARA